MLSWNTIKSYYKNRVYEYTGRKLYLEKYKIYISHNIYYGVDYIYLIPKSKQDIFPASYLIF